MDRRSIFRVMAATVAAVPLLARKSAAADDKKVHRLVLHVDRNDPGVMKLALNNARAAQELYESRGDTLAIELVANGPGLHMLRDDTSPVKDEIKAIRATMPQLALAACARTKRGMEKAEGKPVPIIAEATVVPAGIVRLVDLQEDGYKYVKP